MKSDKNRTSPQGQDRLVCWGIQNMPARLKNAFMARCKGNGITAREGLCALIRCDEAMEFLFGNAIWKDVDILERKRKTNAD